MLFLTHSAPKTATAAPDEGCYGRGGAMVIMMQTMLCHTLCREITHGKVKIIDKIATLWVRSTIFFIFNAMQSVLQGIFLSRNAL